MKIRGFSIIEVMIAISIITLMALTTSAFLPHQKKITAVLQQKLERQEIEQIIMNLLVPAIRQAGYLGCKNLYSEPIQQQTPLLGLTANAVLPPVLKNKVAKQSDILLVNYATVPQHHISTEAGATKIRIPNDFSIQAGEQIMITDCIATDILTVTSRQAQEAYTTNAVSQKYQDAYLAHSAASYFYQGDTGRKTKTGAPIFALYRQPVSGSRQELIEGLESLHFEFASQPESSADYHPLAETVNWQKITHVKVIATLDDDVFSTEVAIKNAQ